MEGDHLRIKVVEFSPTPEFPTDFYKTEDNIVLYRGNRLTYVCGV